MTFISAREENKTCSVKSVPLSALAFTHTELSDFMLLKSGKEPFSLLYAKFLKEISAAISVDLSWHIGIHAKELMK